MDSTSTFTIVSFILSITATIISIIVGASQIWHNKVRIDIVFRRGIVAYDIQDMRKSVFVDIVNKSRFPVSIEQIYFELENKNQYRVMDMLLTTGGAFASSFRCNE